PNGNTLPDGGVQVAANESSTTSLAVATKFTTAPAGPVASAITSDGAVIVGLVVSTTVTLNASVTVFWLESVAEHVTCVMPSAKIDPELTGIVPPELTSARQETASGPSVGSIALTLNDTGAPAGLVASAWREFGTVSDGTSPL